MSNDLNVELIEKNEEKKVDEISKAEENKKDNKDVGKNKKKSDNKEVRYLIDSFLEENIKTKSNGAIKTSFKVWYKIIKKLSETTKRTTRDWQVLLEEFFKREIQN